MNETLAQLLELQDHDGQIIRFSKEVEDIPARKADIEEHVSAARAALDEANDKLKSETVAVKDLEGEVDSTKEMIARLQQQEREVKNNDEYRAIQKELFTLKQRIMKSEDEELKLMEAMEKTKALVAEREHELQDQQEHIREDIDGLDERMQELAARLETLKSERRELIEHVDPKWLARYERVLQHRGGAALVEVANGTCTGCNMALPPQTVQNIKHEDDIVMCDYCGRFLYLPGR